MRVPRRAAGFVVDCFMAASLPFAGRGRRAGWRRRWHRLCASLANQAHKVNGGELRGTKLYKASRLQGLFGGECGNPQEAVWSLPADGIPLLSIADTR